MIGETTIRLVRTEAIEVEVTDALEWLVLETLVDHSDNDKQIREEYEAKDEEGKARWLAAAAVELGIDKFLSFGDSQISFPQA